ncbi:MAG TPA: FliH/SctL family protein [Polyangiaceae bacterium]|nr:FliH/SctL family protein [Polyangiaceae bacterium]
MRWFDRQASEGTKRVKFAEVAPAPAPRRAPSWMAPRPEPERRTESSLKPPKLPSEFVDAVRHEIGEEFVARTRGSLIPEATGPRSEVPPSSTAFNPVPAAQPSFPPPAATKSLVPAAKAMPIVERVPVVDPEIGQAFERAIAVLAIERERVLSETAGQLAELAVLIARRVIGRELGLHPDIVRGLVREGIAALGHHDRVLVRVGRGFAAGREALERDLSDTDKRFEVRVDPALEVYGCVVETELGQVDESIESRLETLLSALRPESNGPGV